MGSKNQLIELINYSPELKKQLKENYYKIKIEEAKNKKKELADNKNSLWELLPPDVEQKILSMKEEGDKIYISNCITAYNLTMKSLEHYLFKVYRNEKREKLNKFLAINHNFKKFLWIMINNKEWSEHYYKHSFSSYDETIKHWKDITKNKAPSLFELIEYRTNEKKEQSEKRKKQNKERAKEEIKTDLKVGDLVYTYDRWNCEAFLITGETKTQWRVDLIEWDNTWHETIHQGLSKNYFELDIRENNWVHKNHKNIGKKKYLIKFNEKHKINISQTYQVEINDYYD